MHMRMLSPLPFAPSISSPLINEIKPTEDSIVEVNKEKPALHQRSFESEVYREYQFQLKNFVEKNLEQLKLTDDFFSKNKLNEYISLLKNLIDLIKKEVPRDYESLSDHYEDVLICLRKLCIKNREQRDSRELRRKKTRLKNRQFHIDLDSSHIFVSRLACWMYTNVELNKGFERFFEKDLSLTLPDSISSCSQYLSNIRNLLAKNPKLNSIRKEEWNELDCHLAGQLPFKVTLLESQAQALYVSHPLATLVSEGQQRIAVVPEFFEYLYALKNQNKNFLKIVFRNRQNPEDVLFLQQYKKLEERFSNFFVIVLDESSEFYYQIKSYKQKNMEIDTFKAYFLKLLFLPSNRSLFYWSEKFDKNKFQKECRHLLDEVFKEYFDGFEHLTIRDRKVAIDLFYARVVDRLCAVFKMDFCGVGCQKQTDKGMSFLALLYANQAWKYKTRMDIEHIQTVGHLAFVPTLLSYNRKPFAREFYRLTDTLKHIERNNCRFATFIEQSCIRV